MRDLVLPTLVALAAVACSGIQEGAVHGPDRAGDALDVAQESGTDPGGLDTHADEGPGLDARESDDAVLMDDATVPADEGPGLDAPASDDAVLMDDAAAPEDGVVEDDGLEPSGDVGFRDADAAEGTETTEAPDTPDPGIPPGTLRHVGWFGPGGVISGNGLTGLGSLSGPRQGWSVK